MNTKEFLVGLLSKTLNMDEEKVSSLFSNDEGTELKPEALKDVLEADKTFKQSLTKTHFDNGMKKATKEIMKDFEKQVREKYEVDSDKQGIELIDELVQAKATPAEMEVNKVKLHPEYLALEKKLKDEAKAKENEWKEKYEGFEKKVAREKTFTEISKKADGLLKDFALPEDEKLRANQKKLLQLELEKFNYQQNGDELIVLDAEGNPLQDGHGSRKNFDEIVKEIASNYWPKMEGQSRAGSGASNNAQGNGKAASAWTGKAPTNETEYINAMGSAKTPEERVAITDAYAASAKGVNV